MNNSRRTIPSIQFTKSFRSITLGFSCLFQVLAILESMESNTLGIWKMNMDRQEEKKAFKMSKMELPSHSYLESTLHTHNFIHVTVTQLTISCQLTHLGP